MDCVQETRVARVIAVWMGVIIGLLGGIATDSPIFRFGPNDTLRIFNIAIDTNARYVAIVSFCFVNSGIRTLNHNILQPWIINVIQDKSNATPITYNQSYELSFVYTIYNWFDFFMYMNILMSQIDMLFVEIFADLIITFLLTTHYVKSKPIKTYELLIEST
jgi:hypothetical protein